MCRKQTINCLFCALLVLACCTSPPAQGVENDKAAAPAINQNAPKSSVPSVFDVPSLLDKNIDQIEQQLGKPTEPEVPNLTLNELERRYRRKGYTLIIDYDTVSRKVAGFIIPATEPAGGTKDCRSLLAAGNVRAGDARYTVDSLAMPTSGYFGSIVISSNSSK